MTTTNDRGARVSPTRSARAGDRTLAYRTVGEGTPLVLCNRFRGTLDTWDPLFLDALAAEGFQVVTFDHSGLGRSTGTPSYEPAALAGDAADLITALDLGRVVLGGWSLGGLAAQVGLAAFGELVEHLVLIGTNPPGPLVKPAEQLFYDVARKPVNDFEDEVVLFFEPRSPVSRAAAERSHRRIAARTDDLSVPVPADWAAAQIGDRPHNPVFPADAVLEVLKTTTTPVLHLGGDHDIVFPVENWYALNGLLPTLRLVTYPGAGHGPQHQHPEESARHIAAFVRTT